MNAADMAELLRAEVETRAARVRDKVVGWRRDIHQHPELANREFRTAALVAGHLRSLGLKVVEQVAHTGVVGLLEGGRPGPVVALRADMDALPVAEETPLPFASRERALWEGMETGVMHACGHDAHTAILMGVAEVLAGMREHIAGTVKFIFQPAEEGTPEGEEGGAELMIKHGALASPEVEAIFGLHVTSRLPVGTIGYRFGPVMAGVDDIRIVVRGRQAHGAMPWRGVDPIVASAQILMGLQTIVSRQIDVTQEPAVVTVGAIHGGTGSNIVPDEVRMLGTVRTYDEPMRAQIHQRLVHTCCRIAESVQAQASVEIRKGYPVTVNHDALAGQAVPVLERVAGKEHTTVMRRSTASEDFSFYQQQVPGFFFFVGCTPAHEDPDQAAPNHSPRFFLDEGALALGVRALAALAVEYPHLKHQRD